jgi:hypothetical protein
VLRSTHEGARDLARHLSHRCQSDLTPRAEKVEMLFAHRKRILKLDRLRLRGPSGAKDEFHLAATAQNLRKTASPSRCQHPQWQDKAERFRSSAILPTTASSHGRVFYHNRRTPNIRLFCAVDRFQSFGRNMSERHDS